MDTLDQRIIANLRTNARRSLSDLAGELRISRATLRSRIARLEESGDILGYTVVLRDDWRDLPIRAMTLVEIAGRNTDPVIKTLSAMTEVRAIHSTNGKWDLVLEIATRDLAAFDQALNKIRLISGVANSETSLLLNTRKGPVAAADRGAPEPQ